MKFAIFGTCKKCGGYMINILDDFTAQYVIPIIKCQKCGYYDEELDYKITEILLSRKALSVPKGE